MRTFIIFCLAVGLTGFLVGQTPTPARATLPTGPLLKRTPDFSTWTVTVQVTLPASAKVNSLTLEPKSDPQKPGVISEADIVKTGKIVRERIIDQAGKKFEVWHSNGVQVVVPADGGTPLVFPDFGGADIYTPNYAVSDFAGLEWIVPENYAGQEKVMGRDCMVFKGPINVLAVDEKHEIDLQADRARMRAEGEAHDKKTTVSKSNDPAPVSDDRTKTNAVAYIDMETRLPLLVVIGKNTRTYKYGPAPAVMLAWPKELTAIQDVTQKRNQELSKLPASP